ncbi:MAG TPA: VOC family protein [Longimicrobium sp.]|nr:VOC family protein [Longimicrobium sp.]
MAENQKPALGTVGWLDLTVDDADGVRDFYAAVVGWRPEPLDMGGYSDYVMNSPETGEGAAGVCHQRGPNVGIPQVWLPYLIVADLDASMAACRERGGEVVIGPRDAGGGARFAIIRDPAGAHAAIFQNG